MDKISLTASMRSNLLSLQNISGQVSSTQNKLSTGNKVNSAIDNPSSYYTARSLNNRADDLNALLDSMGQAVSTIKAATTALESATEFLEQAKAVANQALETAKVPDKAFFEEKVGENGAVVTTAQELRDAIAAGKETICVYGAIDLGDISTSGGLSLKENQKLVGIGYFGNYDTDTNKFSSISAQTSTTKEVIIAQSGSTISDLSIIYGNTSQTGNVSAIVADGQGNKISLNNLDITAKYSDNTGGTRRAIYIQNNATMILSGKIKINTSGYTSNGIGVYNSSLSIQSNAKIDIIVKGKYGNGIAINKSATVSADNNTAIKIQAFEQGASGIYIYDNSNFNLNSGGKISIEAFQDDGKGICIYEHSTCNINKDTDINITTNGANGYGIYLQQSSTANLLGNLYIDAQKGHSLCASLVSGNIINVGNSAQLYLVSYDGLASFYNGYNDGQGPNIFNVSTGAKLAFEKNSRTDWYEVKEDWQGKNDSTTTNDTIAADNVNDRLNIEKNSVWKLPEKVELDFEDGDSNSEAAGQDFESNVRQYQEILNQYDALIKDAGYKGINLLQPDKLTVKFNEDNTAALEVQGRDMSSRALEFTVFEWQTQADINKSIEELTSAINAIRNYSSELGNNYNIITTRQDFTESLINVLTEGADKLTLADMNEESANMLALQTRQQLAINSLSLASQASQSILKLF